MHSFILIPWFKLGPWNVPLPWGGTVALHAFGLLAAIAIIVGARCAQLRAAQLDLPRRVIDDFITWTTLYGILAAYVLNIAMYEPEALAEIARDPGLLLRRWYGLSSYGGFFGGTVAAVIFARRRGVSLEALGDAWCFAFPFAWIFARLGCFVVHDHPGQVSDFFLAVDDYAGRGQPRHDLGLYEVLWSLPVAALFYALSQRQTRQGVFLALIPLLYGPVRFALDFLRARPIEGGDVRYFGLTPGQYASLLATLIGVALCARVFRVRQAASI
ncbi:MAG TPA: prolipoprotein diacylglyceryl transferase family protein [Polyangiales bacterium]|nr:prolipoprotein diacylglyceryl transferase family protein [Polyangiales bacterium]